MQRRLSLLVVAVLAWSQTGYEWYQTCSDDVDDIAACLPEHTLPVRWYRDEIDVQVDARLTDDAPAPYPALQKSLATWNALSCPHVRMVDAGPVEGQDPYKPNGQGGTNLVQWQDLATWYSGGTRGDRVIALTTLFYSRRTGVADSFALELNDGEFEFTTDGSPQVRTDIENTLTHEFGHVLGLDHTSDREATMYLSAPPGEVKKRTLEEDDRVGLCTLYGTEWVEPPDPDDGGGGCASTGGGWPGLAACVVALVVVTVGLRRQRRRRERDASAAEADEGRRK